MGCVTYMRDYYYLLLTTMYTKSYYVYLLLQYMYM